MYVITMVNNMLWDKTCMRVDDGFHSGSHGVISQRVDDGFHSGSHRVISQRVDDGFHSGSHRVISQRVDDGFHSGSHRVISQRVDDGFHSGSHKELIMKFHDFSLNFSWYIIQIPDSFARKKIAKHRYKCSDHIQELLPNWWIDFSTRY